MITMIIAVGLTVSLFLKKVFEKLAEVLGINTGLRHTKRAFLTRKMRGATTYAAWQKLALEMDNIDDFATWKENERTRLYNSAEVGKRLSALEEMEKDMDKEETTGGSNGMSRFLNLLSTDFHRVSCGVTNPPLYRHLTGTKTTIELYIKQLIAMMRCIPHDKSVSSQQKVTALNQVIRSYGRSALMLNSSALLGAYHLGVVKCLHKAGLLPQIIFGCNTGSFVAAFLCTSLDVESVYDTSHADFSAFTKRDKKGSLKRKVDRLWKEGTLMDVGVLTQFAKDNLGDITFLEAYEKTGRILNIHVSQRKNGKSSHQTSILLNYLTTPHVLVRTATVASCALRGFYGAVPLLARALDGTVVPFDPAALSFADSLSSFHVNHAVSRMRELFNINCFIVSDATIKHCPLLRLQSRKGILAKSAHFFLEEWWRFLAAVSRVPLFQSRFTGFLQTMTEPVMGDVVISPVTQWADLLNLVLSNPDEKLLNYCQQRGEQASWGKLAHIRTHVAVEIALGEALKSVQHNISSGVEDDE